MVGEPKEKPVQPEIKPKTPSSPLVFISHDARDAELAEAFSKLLRSVSAGMLKSFYSSDKKVKQGIEFGAEWYQSLMKEISSASVVVCLLTERSLGRPWILYEAGFAKGKLDAPIIGIALGIPLSKASIGPFQQFQNCDDDVESLTKLIMQVANRIPELDPDPGIVKAQVETFKNEAETIIKKLAGIGGHEKEGESSIQKISQLKGGSVSPDLSPAALDILEVYHKLDEICLYDEARIYSELHPRYSKIQMKSALVELERVGIVESASMPTGHGTLYCLTELGMKFIPPH